MLRSEKCFSMVSVSYIFGHSNVDFFEELIYLLGKLYTWDITRIFQRRLRHMLNLCEAGYTRRTKFGRSNQILSNQSCVKASLYSWSTGHKEIWSLPIGRRAFTLTARSLYCINFIVKLSVTCRARNKISLVDGWWQRFPQQIIDKLLSTN